MHPFVVSSIYYYVSIILNWGFFAALDVKTKQLCNNTHLNVSFRIRIYVQNLEFAFERPKYCSTYISASPTTHLTCINTFNFMLCLSKKDSAVKVFHLIIQ